MQNKARLNPKNDFLFKRLFGEEAGKPLLIGLLNAVLRRDGKARITNVIIVDDTRLSRELVENKEVVMDIKCEVEGEENVNVEMQIRRYERMDSRSLYYVSGMLGDSLRQGQPYSSVKRAIGINILDHVYLPLDKYHSTFHLYEDEQRDYLLTDLLELHFIECPKFRKLAFDLHDPLHRWLRFLEQSTTREQLKELMGVDEVIKEAEERLDYLASDEETRGLYRMREKALHDQASLVEDAEQRGIKQGLERGLKQGMKQGSEQRQKEIALKMLEEGIPVSVISKVVGMDEEHIVQMHKNVQSAAD
ncbi:Rpn family recombination-promoting nuclease/putative transposase [Cohnella cellulosilytica]|uniref:Rpn family recombination-promoting nuclease/putative transposase n=1 Tax=Cohnella cellulosilytica TaxID=986710 RepID=A0ABW2F4Y3_9BACL